MTKSDTGFKMISIVITSFNEPETIGGAIESFIKQDIKKRYELIVAAPDIETHKIVEDYKKKYNQIKLVKDPGKGKSYAINWLLPKLKGDIIIFSDGDVYVSENSIGEILKEFKSKDVGCVSGHPVPQNSKGNIFGYWAHLLCNIANNWRKKRSDRQEFLECSGYLWAFQNRVIKHFPLDVGEDTIIPILFFLKGYKIRYASEAKVYVKFPNNLGDFIKQKRRAAGAHDNISKYVHLKKIPRMKTLFNEIIDSYKLFSYPQNYREFFWTIFLFPLRLYIWMNLLYNSKIRGKKYTDAWKRIESTK